MDSRGSEGSGGLQLRDTPHEAAYDPASLGASLALLVELRTQMCDLIRQHLDERTVPSIILSRLRSAGAQPDHVVVTQPIRFKMPALCASLRRPC